MTVPDPHFYRRATYLTSATRRSQLPPDSGCEVAFAGRSNAGKSSAINLLTGNRQLARTSKTPGRTQMINFFALDEARRLVDLPGYGYAKVAQQTKRNWEGLLDDYLRTRHSLQGVVLLMDSRHPLKPFDQQLLQWCREARLPVHILLSKADKLGRGTSQACIHQVRRHLQDDRHGRHDDACERISVQLFSALQRQGIDEARNQIEIWLGDRDNPY